MNMTDKYENEDDEYDIYDDDSQLHLPIPDLSLVTARIDNEGTEVNPPIIWLDMIWESSHNTITMMIWASSRSWPSDNDDDDDYDDDD